MSHCYSSFGCSSCHQQRAAGTQNRPSLQAASATAGARFHATLHAWETTKAGLWRMEQSWKTTAATSHGGSVAPDISPPRRRTDRGRLCPMAQINRASRTARTSRRGRWQTETWWWWPREDGKSRYSHAWYIALSARGNRYHYHGGGDGDKSRVAGLSQTMRIAPREQDKLFLHQVRSPSSSDVCVDVNRSLGRLSRPKKTR